MMSYKHPDNSDPFYESLENNEQFLKDAESDLDKQRKLALFAEKRYGVKAIMNKDGTYGILEPNKDTPTNIVELFRECIDIAKFMRAPRDIIN